MEIIVTLCIAMLFASLNDAYGEANTFKIVQTHDGPIRGVQNFTLFRNVSYYSFRGVPFAEKPIANLRFKAPTPVKSWEPKILDAFQYRNSCIQQSFAIGNWGPQSEDCLYMNIFVPANTKKHEKLAVIFFIHGGGFAEGSGNDYFYGPDFLIEQGVILVTINYRLGIFGFLSLNTNKYSGNMGLKDQYLALKWTHHNIESFGGDKKRITVMGQSAGAASAHYHVLIPKSRKLIRRAICLSGSALLRYSYLDINSHLDKMYEFAGKANASVNNSKELIAFLQQVPVEIIVNLTSQTSFDRTLIFDWAPVIEKKSAVQPILVKTPEEMYQSCSDVNVDTMFGYTNYECLSLVWADVSNSTRLDAFLDEFNLVLPVHKLKPQFQSKSYRRILNQIKDFYFGNVTTEHEKAVQFVNMISDLNMVSRIDTTVKIQTKQSNKRSYYYQFSVDGKLDYVKQTQNITWPGASHCDDLCYTFRCHSLNSIYGNIIKHRHTDLQSNITYNTIEIMSQMYANFAKSGRPTINGMPVEGYKPVRRRKVNFLDVTNDALIIGQAPKNDAVHFWKRIMRKAESLVSG